LIGGNVHQLWVQLLGVVAGGGYAIVVTLLLLFVLGKTMGLRVEKDDERMGLDQSSHSETGYNY
jgi:Amt family ammonium transporter